MRPSPLDDALAMQAFLHGMAYLMIGWAFQRGEIVREPLLIVSHIGRIWALYLIGSGLIFSGYWAALRK